MSMPPAADAILERLNPEQRAAAEQVRGPVQILAGAGTGKTTTVTHRIAWQVESGAWQPRDILAVTFTRKAASELVTRLAALGVRGVEARTFHSAALWMLRFLWPQYTGTPLPELVQSKTRLLNPIVQALPAPYCFRARRDVATDIEWAKSQRIAAGEYGAAAERAGRSGALPPDLGQRVFFAYERECERLGQWDFDDVLLRLLELFDRNPEAVERIQRRFRAFTVDEYQDVSPLQQALLDYWLGERDDVCVVGDDLQTVFSFTGATPAYLVEFPRRFPQARIAVLETNYRSTPQILDVANRLAAHFGDRARALRPVSDRTANSQAAPELLECASDVDEAIRVASRARELHEQHDVPWSEIAVLYRINALSEPFEEAFSTAGIPYRVVGGTFLERAAARQLLPALRARRAHPSAAEDVVAAVRTACERLGMNAEDSADDEELTRRSDLRRFVGLAERYVSAEQSPGLRGFLDDLDVRFRDDVQDANGVQLLTLHRSKGLEFDAVFLVRSARKLIPYQRKGAAGDESEERRLFYVGLTRARRYLSASWDAGAGPSPFVEDAFDYRQPRRAGRAAGPRTGGSSRGAAAASLEGDALERFERLRAWRAGEAKRRGKPAYIVFGDKVLAAIAESGPSSEQDLLAISGVGPAKLAEYGADVLDVLSGS